MATRRPRDIGSYQAAAILYGDWGTSKAYVLGLAFALAAYSSFWIMVAVALLNILVGLNYIIICKYYPYGGGVYTSVRGKSEILALTGALFLIADYLVTAALSALSALQYMGFPNPVLWASISVLVIGAVNFLGPRHTGNMAAVISLFTVACVVVLGLFTIPYLPDAWARLEPPASSFSVNWEHFVGVIVALSGIEAIANTTGLMKLDPRSEAAPSVMSTATPAILVVMFEVTFFTTLFALAMQALPGLTVNGDEVNAPGYPNVRDYMLRYMSNQFVGNILGWHWGMLFGYVISIAFFLLLLSAVNTAIIALTALLFVMSRDGELPTQFQKLNHFGVPIIPLLIATLIPTALIIGVSDVAGLANLYAIGFVGAIAANLGFTAFDPEKEMSAKTRWFMLITFLIMLAIELTLLIDKPEARNFVVGILVTGLILRGLVHERERRRLGMQYKGERKEYQITDESEITAHPNAALCVISHVGKTLQFALDECKKIEQPLYLLFIREQPAIPDEEQVHNWVEDARACEIFDYAAQRRENLPLKFIYMVSDSTATSISKVAQDLQVSRIIIGMPRKSRIVQLITGNILKDLTAIIPPEVVILVVC